MIAVLILILALSLAGCSSSSPSTPVPGPMPYPDPVFRKHYPAPPIPVRKPELPTPAEMPIEMPIGPPELPKVVPPPGVAGVRAEPASAGRVVWFNYLESY